MAVTSAKRSHTHGSHTHGNANDRSADSSGVGAMAALGTRLLAASAQTWISSRQLSASFIVCRPVGINEQHVYQGPEACRPKDLRPAPSKGHNLNDKRPSVSEICTIF